MSETNHDAPALIAEADEYIDALTGGEDENWLALIDLTRRMRDALVAATRDANKPRRSLAQMRINTAQWRVRCVWPRLDTGEFGPFPADPEEGWQYYQRESNMRLPQTALVSWNRNGTVTSQVQRRNARGDWEAVDDYVW